MRRSDMKLSDCFRAMCAFLVVGCVLVTTGWNPPLGIMISVMSLAAIILFAVKNPDPQWWDSNVSTACRRGNWRHWHGTPGERLRGWEGQKDADPIESIDEFLILKDRYKPRHFNSEGGIRDER